MKQFRAHVFLHTMVTSLLTMAIVFQWLWVAMLYMPMLSENEWVQQNYIRQTQTAPSSPAVELPSLPEPLALGIALAAGAFALAMCVYAISRMPKAAQAARTTSAKVIVKTALPIVTHHKKVSKKRQRILGHRIILAVIVVTFVVPYLAAFLAPIPTSLPVYVANVVNNFLLAISVLLFAMYVVSGYFRSQRSIKPENT